MCYGYCDGFRDVIVIGKLYCNYYIVSITIQNTVGSLMVLLGCVVGVTNGFAMLL